MGIHMDHHLYQKHRMATDDSGHQIAVLDRETQFTKLMGHLDILEPLRSRFYMYFPCLILLITGATYKKLGTRCINYIGFFQFLDTSESSSKDNFTNDIISMGKALVQMEKAKISEDPGLSSYNRETSSGPSGGIKDKI